MGKPLVHALLDTFSRASEGMWNQWIYHFNNVAQINYRENEEKLKWLKVNLTGRVWTVFNVCHESTRELM